MQIRTEGPGREEGYSLSTEPKVSNVPEKNSAPSVSFMDLMKSIQLRSQKVLEEGQRSEIKEEKTPEAEESKEPELFVRSEEEKVEETDSEEEDSEKLVRLSEKKMQKTDSVETDPELEEEIDPEFGSEELDSPFITQMSVFLAGLEAKKEKEIASAANQEESVSTKKIQKHSKEESTTKAEQKEESGNVSVLKSNQPEEKRSIKEAKKTPEKESLDEGMKSLEEARKFSKPANEEKILTVLKDSHKENFIPESENWKITREKRQETLSMDSKNQAAKAAQVEEASKSDTSGKGSQNQEFSQRNGNETTFTLLKAGLGVVEKNQEVSGQNKTSKANPGSSMDRTQMKENFQRLVQSAKLNIVENGRSEATLRLNPRELGRVSLRITVEDDKVQGKILVESDQVRKLFAGDLEQLRKDFKEQGLDLQSLIVESEDSLRMSWDGQDSSRFFDQEGFGFESSGFSNSSDLEEVSEMDSIENLEFAEKNTDKRLNILV
ncbi:flagellar hook-length control protein FliK [Leptospira licerasiae]|uniref:Flagellar hook-length control protein FliK n=1 Tax=Leptospira licerasiae str. MMD4847 TaxID=1049971 RepID=A0ABN0H3I1_9LEPT|nr:flagellar hook-length control protein FliK [Leptospira licerasiae]EIE00552.1 flagellar hook-length control protein FliK [Leptospira licerasiae serovar Varillal str. VAR 010]EJZ40146.1 flagellar hook-length control protein FliK [Leptospira licerasiae str. MMD4847]